MSGEQASADWGNMTLSQVQLGSTAGDWDWQTSVNWCVPAYYHFCSHPMPRNEMEQAFKVLVALMADDLLKIETVKEFIGALQKVSEALK